MRSSDGNVVAPRVDSSMPCTERIPSRPEKEMRNGKNSAARAAIAPHGKSFATIPGEEEADAVAVVGAAGVKAEERR